jgi:hypothetical protein
MRQTTVRFGADLWADLEREAQRAGVSAAQYIRDATLARIAYNAGARGEAGPGATAERPGAPMLRAVTNARERVSDSEAVWAQARLARERSRRVRDGARNATGRRG